MNALEVFRSALRGMSSNVMRSVLTLLGVLIGVGSVILLVGVGAGSAKAVSDQINSLGTTTLHWLMPHGVDAPGATAAIVEGTLLRAWKYDARRKEPAPAEPVPTDPSSPSASPTSSSPSPSKSPSKTPSPSKTTSEGPTSRPPSPPPTQEPPRPGHLTVNGCDMGHNRSCTITVTAVGGPVNWRVTGASGELRASGSGHLAAGQSSGVTVSRTNGTCWWPQDGSVSCAPGGSASVGYC